MNRIMLLALMLVGVMGTMERGSGDGSGCSLSHEFGGKRRCPQPTADFQEPRWTALAHAGGGPSGDEARIAVQGGRGEH